MRATSIELSSPEMVPLGAGAELSIAALAGRGLIDGAKPLSMRALATERSAWLCCFECGARRHIITGGIGKSPATGRRAPSNVHARSWIDAAHRYMFYLVFGDNNHIAQVEPALK